MEENESGSEPDAHVVGFFGKAAATLTTGATAIVDFKTDQFVDAELAAERQRDREAYDHAKTCSAEVSR